MRNVLHRHYDHSTTKIISKKIQDKILYFEI